MECAKILLFFQIVLINPISFIGYAYVSWLFFNDRIHYEEYTLIKMFGFEYIRYREKVRWSGLPFIKGYDASQKRTKNE